MNAGEAGHGIQPAAPDDANFCLLQYGSLQGAIRDRKLEGPCASRR
jgi:hypothetical protein